MVCLCCRQREIHEFAITSFVPFDQSYFNTPNLAGALAVVQTGITEDSDEMRKTLRETVSRHTSLRCEYFHCLVLLLLIVCTVPAASSQNCLHNTSHTSPSCQNGWQCRCHFWASSRQMETSIWAATYYLDEDHPGWSLFPGSGAAWSQRTGSESTSLEIGVFV